MRLTRLLLPATIFCTLLTSYSTPIYGQDESKTTEITGLAENPKDGSIWIGTRNEGVFRISRKGNRLAFSEKGGVLSSNNIIGIMFDRDGELLIFDSLGNLTTYTTNGGFNKIKLEIGPTKSAVLDKNNNRALISTVTKIYSLDLTTKSISQILETVDESTTLLPSEKDSTVWILTESGIKILLHDGSVKAWDNGTSISDLLPFVFETSTPVDASNGTTKLPIKKVILWLCLGLVCGFVVGDRAERKVGHTTTQRQTKKDDHAPTAPVKPQESVAVNVRPEPQNELKPTNIESAPVTKSDGLFRRQIEELIDKNLADKDFDVEAIAALLGISRIHVNRKLKAEGSPSPSVLIKDKRMAKAKELLTEGKTTVSQIAEICGFRSSSYFTTAFKEYTGLTPSEFSSLKRP